MCVCREWWERCSEEEKAGQVLNVVGKLVNEIEDLQESMAARKRRLLLDNGLEWKTFRSYVHIACTDMVSGPGSLKVMCSLPSFRVGACRRYWH